MAKNNTGFDEGKIDFVGKMKIFGGISLVLTILSLLLITFKGFNYGIDFAGGTEIQIKFNQKLADDSALRNFLKAEGLENVHLQKFGEDSEYLIRFEAVKGKSEKETNDIQNETVKRITGGLQTSLGTFGPEIRRVDSVGPQVGDQLKRNAQLAVFYCLLVILIYVGLRFEYEFAPGAVVCLFHDAIFTIGIFSLLGKEINVTILAAVLTIIGYSLNDTIVIYDRIRENLGLYKNVPLAAIINRSTNDTLGRTMLTSLTILMSSLALYLFAGGVIEDFGFAMFIGVIVGTYSSVYVAAPLILIFQKLGAKKAVTA